MTDNNKHRTPYEEFVKEVGEMIDDLTLRLDLPEERREAIGLFTFEQVRCRLYLMQHGITKQQFLSYVNDSFQDNVCQFKQISPALKKLQEIGKENMLCRLKKPVTPLNVPASGKEPLQLRTTRADGCRQA